MTGTVTTWIDGRVQTVPASTTCTKLAERYGMAVQTVSRIRRGETHRHLLEAR